MNHLSFGSLITKSSKDIPTEWFCLDNKFFLHVPLLSTFEIKSDLDGAGRYINIRGPIKRFIVLLDESSYKCFFLVFNLFLFFEAEFRCLLSVPIRRYP